MALVFLLWFSLFYVYDRSQFKRVPTAMQLTNFQTTQHLQPTTPLALDSPAQLKYGRQRRLDRRGIGRQRRLLQHFLFQLR